MVFAMADSTAVKGIDYEPYTAKSGMSVAANMREALRTSPLLARGGQRAQVLIDSQAILVPIEEFDESQADALYRYTVVTPAADVVMHSVLPSLNCVALFAVNRDLRTVIDDRYADVRYLPVEQPVWGYMHRRSYTDGCRRLYAYFHDERLAVFAFDKNRFRFYNSYASTRIQDSAYYILYVWNLLHMDASRDELYVAGSMADADGLLTVLRCYLRKAYAISAPAEFNRAPITDIKGIALDMVTLYLKGR